MARKKIEQAVLLDGKVYMKRPDASLVPAEDRSDWARVDAMTDEDIERAIAEDPDAPPLLDDDWFAHAEENRKRRKQPVTLRLDAEVLDYFKAKGEKGYQTRINAVLRNYVERKTARG